MREMFYTSQPMEMVDNREGARGHLQDDQRGDAACSIRPTIRIGTWTCRATIYDLPFLNEQAKRNILGGNAQRLFKLEPEALAGETGAQGDAAGPRSRSGDQQGARPRAREVSCRPRAGGDP